MSKSGQQPTRIKNTPPDGLQGRSQLMKEVDLLKRLSHPSIVKYEGMSRDADNLSIVLEYAENGSLGQTLKAFGKLNERLVAGYVTKILEGLHYLHRSQVVHCDLKAANILTTKNGNVKLTDFGVSLNLHAMENIKNDVAGTPNWMAPEVIELKGASTASDIWSLGCTVIELLTGKPPYAEIQNGLSVMFRIVDDPSPPLPANCSPALKDFFSLCFSRDPAERPSAELLFEHPWLKNNWGEHKELRPQDSIPFLRRVSADLQRTNLAHQISFAESTSTPSTPGAPIAIERRHTFVKTNFSQAIECRVCYTSVKKSAMLCQGCSLICHARCTTEAPINCDLQEQMRTFAEHQLQPPRARSNSILGSSSSPAEGVLSSSPSSFPYILTGFRKLRHSTSSMAGDQSQAARSTASQPLNAVPAVAHSVRSSSSGSATATTSGSRFSARVSFHLRDSRSPSGDDSSQRVVATPSPAPPTSLHGSDRPARRKSKDTKEGRTCVIQ